MWCSGLRIWLVIVQLGVWIPSIAHVVSLSKSNFTLIAWYWLVRGTDSSVILHSNYYKLRALWKIDFKIKKSPLSKRKTKNQHTHFSTENHVHTIQMVMLLKWNLYTWWFVCLQRSAPRQTQWVQVPPEMERSL